MDLATIIGLVLGTALVASAIVMGPSPIIFVNIAGILIVVGGTLGVTFIRNRMGAVFGTVKVVRGAFTQKLKPPADLIEQVVHLSRKARKESLLSLEKENIDDEFLDKAVRLAVDGMEPESIRSVLETEIAFLRLRHQQGQELLEGIGECAPAFGMVGTLIGLVNMLANMDDPKSIGPSMAVAILTTLYGALIANLVALPLAAKLKNRSAEETLLKRVALQGVLSMVEGDHPASVEQKLVAFVAPRERKTEGKAQKAS
jgi:chemotaxis protein MotA